MTDEQFDALMRLLRAIDGRLAELAAALYVSRGVPIQPSPVDAAAVSCETSS